MVSKSDGEKDRYCIGDGIREVVRRANLDEFIDDLANKVLEGTEGWDRVQFVNRFLQVEKITKEQKQKNREDWR